MSFNEPSLKNSLLTLISPKCKDPGKVAAKGSKGFFYNKNRERNKVKGKNRGDAKDLFITKAEPGRGPIYFKKINVERKPLRSNFNGKEEIKFNILPMRDFNLKKGYVDPLNHKALESLPKSKSGTDIKRLKNLQFLEKISTIKSDNKLVEFTNFNKNKGLHKISSGSKFKPKFQKNKKLSMSQSKKKNSSHSPTQHRTQINPGKDNHLERMKKFNSMFNSLNKNRLKLKIQKKTEDGLYSLENLLDEFDKQEDGVNTQSNKESFSLPKNKFTATSNFRQYQQITRQDAKIFFGRSHEVSTTANAFSKRALSATRELYCSPGKIDEKKVLQLKFKANSNNKS